MNTLKLLSYSLAAAVLFAACSGNSLIDTTNPSGSAGLGELDIAMVHHLEDGSGLSIDPDGGKTLTNDLGYTVDFEAAKLNWHSLKLISSGDDPDCEGGLDQELDIDASEDLLGEDLLTHVLASHEIPLAAYCSYELTLAPGSASGAALKNHAGEDHGAASTFPESFHLAGTWTKGVDSGNFHIDTTDSVTVSGLFHARENGELVAHPLHFHEGETAAEAHFETKYDLLVRGVDFKNQSEDQQRERVLANLQDAIGQHLDEH
ncbi:MAG: hypothetical protein U1F66_10450 [bacterium]